MIEIAWELSPEECLAIRRLAEMVLFACLIVLAGYALLWWAYLMRWHLRELKRRNAEIIKCITDQYKKDGELK